MNAGEMRATLFPQEWDVIGNALAKEPYHLVAGLMSKLQSQLAAQAINPEGKADGHVGDRQSKEDTDPA